MTTIKNYTDLRQSKKLAKILPLESADMYYQAHYDSKNNLRYILRFSSTFVPFKVDIPAWNLTTLLSVIPKHIKDYNVLRVDISENKFAIWYDEIGYGVNNNLPNITMESAVDACYEMIVKLNELKML